MEQLLEKCKSRFKRASEPAIAIRKLSVKAALVSAGNLATGGKPVVGDKSAALDILLEYTRRCRAVGQNTLAVYACRSSGLTANP
ncbi:MAG: hypothetical protein CMM01_20415 [Rhodopirellula sp.]|nr:hypothetical protein [Rhodopirellula sp.]